jgi:hypothetical protein
MRWNLSRDFRIVHDMSRRPWTAWLKRIGVAGFLFFLIKGLLWLAVAGVVVLWFR